MPSGPGDIESRSIRVSGLVQGVGFRPMVWRLAHDEGLTGFVLNDGSGVAMEVTGPRDAIERFCQRIRAEAPPLARIDRIQTMQINQTKSLPRTFIIRASVDGGIATGIVPDAATCPACIKECRDPADRRYGYAFTNCTHCGPRLSIVEAIPYDRQMTTMSRFAMCPDCQREYDDPADRRFHAQPNACPRCGPQLWLEDETGRHAEDNPIAAAARLLREGRIVAIKGLGGFHLACDASQRDVVVELRRRKMRDSKPLAMMVRDLAMAEQLAEFSNEEAAMLSSTAAPIVLVRCRGGATLAPEIAPGQARVGIMLPYTPLHHLLISLVQRPLVMTSGNLSNEPQCVANDEARTRLRPIADAWLMHDRDIANRVDDSVVRVDHHGPTILRRARGFAPAPIALASGFHASPDVLAFGGELKSTFCFLRDGTATLSQHLGDLEEPATCEDYRKSLGLYRRLFGFEPRTIAIDKHPDYSTSAWGAALANELGVSLVRVQHHHAHLAAVMAENQIEPDAQNVLGIILDGTGLGDDGTIWGGEFLLGGYRSFERVGHLDPIALAGGAAAVREPWRNTVVHLRSADILDAGASGDCHPTLTWLCDKPVGMINKMLDRGINTPLASSAGRLFDAVAGAIGVCRDRQEFEGQAAMRLETLAGPHLDKAEPYPLRIGDTTPAVVSFAPMWPAILHDLVIGVDLGLVSARFHRTLIDALWRTTERIARHTPISAVALSGGVFQNRILLDGVGAELEGHGWRVLRHRKVPANDGGLSLGQAAVAAVSLSD